MSSSKPRDECQHGSLRRQCEICERDETIERLQRELAIVTRDRDTLLEMTGTTIQQVARRIEKLRGTPAEIRPDETTKAPPGVYDVLRLQAYSSGTCPVCGAFGLTDKR